MSLHASPMNRPKAAIIGNVEICVCSAKQCTKSGAAMIGNQMQQSLAELKKAKSLLEARGIDPRTSRMLSERSTI